MNSTTTPAPAGLPVRPRRRSPRIAAASIWTAMSFPRPAAALPPAAGRSEAITPPVRQSGKVVNIHATAQLQVVLVKPDRFDSVTEIAEHLRSKHAVVLNLGIHEQRRRPPSGRFPVRLRLCARRQDQKDRHQHLHHHAVQRRLRRRQSDGRIGKQRRLSLIVQGGSVHVHTAGNSGANLLQGRLRRL